MGKQLKLEFLKPEKKPAVTYATLSIHEKINYKANLCGFEQQPYLNRYYYFGLPISNNRDRYDILTKKYYTHYRINSGGEVRLMRWRNEKTLFQGKSI